MRIQVAIIIFGILVIASLGEGKGPKKCRKGYELKVVRQASKNQPRVTKCKDTSECAKSKPCEQICTNTAGSFLCSCRVGFTIDPANKRKCIAVSYDVCGQGYENDPNNVGKCWDINECDTLRPCDQVCVNTNGSYSCSCRPGYSIDLENSNRCTLDKPATTCKPGYTQTSSGCIVLAPACNPGYNLTEDGCEDINECRSSSRCEHNCENFQGSYTCSCQEGYEVDETNTRKCSQIQQCTGLADIILVLDSSGSMGDLNNQLQLSFASRFASSHFDVDASVRFGALLFSDIVAKLFDLNDYDNAEDVRDAIREAPYLQGTTLTNEALDYIRTNSMFSTTSGGQSDAADIVIVFTDGQSTYPDKTLAAADNLKRDNVKIIAVGIGKEVSEDELNQMASSRNDVFLVPSVDRLDYIEHKLAENVCSSAS